MNKWKIGVVLAGVVMLVLGILLFVFGLSLGASPVVAVGKNGRNTVDRKLITGSVDITEFNSLNVDVTSMEVEFKTGDKYAFEYTVYDDDVPDVKQNGQELTIKQPDHSYFIRLDLRGINDHEKEKYIITVPKNDKSYELDYRASSGSLNVEDINISGNVEITSGDVYFKGTASDDLTFKASSGDMNLSGSNISRFKSIITSGSINANNCEFDDINTKMTSGEMNITDSKCNTAFFDMTSGDVDLQLIGSEDDYSYDFDMTSGEVKLADVEFNGDYRKDNNTGKEIKIRMTSGSAVINFK